MVADGILLWGIISRIRAWDINLRKTKPHVFPLKMLIVNDKHTKIRNTHALFLINESVVKVVFMARDVFHGCLLTPLHMTLPVIPYCWKNVLPWLTVLGTPPWLRPGYIYKINLSVLKRQCQNSLAWNFNVIKSRNYGVASIFSMYYVRRDHAHMLWDLIKAFITLHGRVRRLWAEFISHHKLLVMV